MLALTNAKALVSTTSLLASSEQGLQRALDRFSAACSQAGMKVSTKNDQVEKSLQKPNPVRAASKRHYNAAGHEGIWHMIC